MDGEQLARATAAALGGEAEAATREVLEGGQSRTFGVSEALATGTFIVSIAQVAVTWYQAKTSRKELIAGLLKDELASGGLSRDKREEIIGRMADQLLGAPRSEAVSNGKRDFLMEWSGGSAAASQDKVRSFRPSGEPVKTREFLGVPSFAPFADQDYWYLREPLVWRSEKTVPRMVEVPAGFVTDFASIPSMFWTWMPKTGRYGLPAIAHDWLYWEQPGARGEADRLLAAAMGDLRVSGVQRGLIYRAVQLFGGFAWKGNAKAKAAGEKRVLKKFPPDASITWDEWREKRDVFV